MENVIKLFKGEYKDSTTGAVTPYLRVSHPDHAKKMRLLNKKHPTEKRRFNADEMIEYLRGVADWRTKLGHGTHEEYGEYLYVEDLTEVKI